MKVTTSNECSKKINWKINSLITNESWEKLKKRSKKVSKALKTSKNNFMILNILYLVAEWIMLSFIVKIY